MFQQTIKGVLGAILTRVGVEIEPGCIPLTVITIEKGDCGELLRIIRPKGSLIEASDSRGFNSTSSCVNMLEVSAFCLLLCDILEAHPPLSVVQPSMLATFKRAEGIPVWFCELLKVRPIVTDFVRLRWSFSWLC